MDKQTQRNLVLHYLCNEDGKYTAGRWRAAAKLPWLEQIEGDCLAEKVWNVFNDRPLCHCGNPTKFIDFTLGYRPYCSRTCFETCPNNLRMKKERHDALWENPTWKKETSIKMRLAHAIERTPRKLANLKEAKNIICLDEIYPEDGQKAHYRWQHNCGEIFTKSFARIENIYCPICHVSIGQGQLFEFIKRHYAGKIIVNDRTVISPKEIDIYLPEIKLGFEYNGKYWHTGDGTREAYKSTLAEAAGIKIVHIWELEWKKERAQQEKRVLHFLSESRSF